MLPNCLQLKAEALLVLYILAYLLYRLNGLSSHFRSKREHGWVTSGCHSVIAKKYKSSLASIVFLTCGVISRWHFARDVLRDGNVQRHVRRRRSHLDDACAVRPDAAEQVRAAGLRSRGLRCWRHGGGRPALFGSAKLWDRDTWRVVRRDSALPAGSQAVPGGCLPLCYW